MSRFTLSHLARTDLAEIVESVLSDKAKSATSKAILVGQAP